MVYLLYHIKSVLGRCLDAEDTVRLNLFFERIIAVYYKLTPRRRRGVLNHRAKRKLIISMTTIPSRLDKIWIVIESLLRQTYKPDQIILWLAEEEFAEVELPERIRYQMKRGLTVRYCDNLKSYKKFYYTMEENPNAFVVTVDDDIIYAETMVATLARTYRDNPGTVICNISHLIKKRRDGCAPYDDWIKYENRDRVDGRAQYSNFFIGCAGTFFPVYLLDKKVLDKKKFMQLAPTADDVWLNFICWISGLRVKNTESILGNVINISEPINDSLMMENVVRKKNDSQIKAVLEYLKIDTNDYM